MFLKLAHTNMDAHGYAFELVLEVYRITKDFPDHERYNMTSQIRRAAVSIRLNVAEGSSRKSVIERMRFYEIARGSLIEMDAALDLVVGLGYMESGHLNTLGELIVSCFKILSGLIKKATTTQITTTDNSQLTTHLSAF